MRNDFAIFIITYKRPDKQLTYTALKNCGYTGKIYFIVDNTDDTIQQYIDNYGVENIIVFDKNHYMNSSEYDNCINKGVFATAVYARRAVEDIAAALKLPFFAVVDDDIKTFVIRYPSDGKLIGVKIDNFDLILSAYIDVLDTNNIASVGFGNARSYFGGANAFSPSRLTDRILITNFYLRKSAIPVKWVSWTLEDDITVLLSSKVGNLWLSIPYIQQVPSKFNDLTGTGGNVDLYKETSRYETYFSEIKHFPTMQIQCTDYKTREVKLVRRQNKCFQKILSSTYRKEE